MATESPSQNATVGRVMHEFKHGLLKSAGHKVRSPRQAIAIGLSEAGASRTPSPKRNSAAGAKSAKRRAKQ